MRNTITKTYHKTRVNYSYVEITTGKTFTETTYLDNWLNNISHINTKLNESANNNNIKVYSINSIEHVSVKAIMTDKLFTSLATVDEKSIVVIKKLR